MLNHRADEAARALASRRAAGSLRELCLAQREEALAWEVEAIQSLARVAAFYDST